MAIVDRDTAAQSEINAWQWQRCSRPRSLRRAACAGEIYATCLQSPAGLPLPAYATGCQSAVAPPGYYLLPLSVYCSWHSSGCPCGSPVHGLPRRAAPSCHRARGTPWQSPRRTRVCFDDRLQCLHRVGSDHYNLKAQRGACVFKTIVAYVRAIERGCPAALVCPTSAKWLGLRPPRVSTLCPAVADAESAPLDAGRALHFLHALGHASWTTAILCGTFESVSAPHTQTE